MKYWNKSFSLYSPSHFKIIVISGYLLFLCSPFSVLSQIEDSRKTLRKANAFVDNGKVVISAFKAIRYSKSEHNDLFKDIRVYRLSCPDFKFGVDYEEYFNTLNYKKSELIFQGNIDPMLGTKYTFSDETAKKGGVYAYWIASSDGEPLGPLPVKVRDTKVWWSYDTIISLLENLKNKYPKYVMIDQIGYSINHKPMFGIKIGRGKPSVALVGAIHAGESGPELIIPILEKLIIDYSGILDKTSIIAIPSINPDKRDELVHGTPWYLRKNFNNVDLNRNFSAYWEEVDSTYGYRTSDPDGLTYRGPFAASEPETKAVMDFLKKNKPRVVFSFHCLASIAGETLVVSEASMNNKEYVDQCYKFANLYWEGIDPLLFKNKKLVFGCTRGSLPTWCYKELGIPAYDVEGPEDSKDLVKCAADSTDIVLLKKYQERHLNGFIKLLKSF